MYSRSIKLSQLNQSFKAPEFVALACTFHSHIQVRNNLGSYNAKSMMGMLALDPTDGSLVLTAEGEDETKAVDDLVSFLLNLP